MSEENPLSTEEKLLRIRNPRTSSRTKRKPTRYPDNCSNSGGSNMDREEDHAAEAAATPARATSAAAAGAGLRARGVPGRAPTPFRGPNIQAQDNQQITSINIRSVSDSIPYFKGNLRPSDITSGTESNPVSLKVWLNALQAFFESENITADSEKISRLIHYTDKKHGDANNFLTLFLENNNRHLSFQQIVTELKKVYHEDISENLHSAVKKAFTLNISKANPTTIPEVAANLERSARRMVNAYKSRNNYNMQNDQRSVEEILTEYTYFNLMCWYCQPKVIFKLIDKETENSVFSEVRQRFISLLHNAPTELGESIIRDPERKTEKNCYAGTQEVRRREPSFIDNRTQPWGSQRTKPTSQESGESFTKEWKCFRCGKPGHFKKDCRVNMSAPSGRGGYQGRGGHQGRGGYRGRGGRQGRGGYQGRANTEDRGGASGGYSQK